MFPAAVPSPSAPPLPACLHCERRPAVTRLGLCDTCRARRCIRVLYIRRRHWTPEWEQHLRRLTERAKNRQPLFDSLPPSGALP